jgi:hypothetical protein
MSDVRPVATITDTHSTSQTRRPGLMSAPIPDPPAPGLMSIGSRPVRPLMEPDPNAPVFDRSRDGIAFLWLVALILAIVLSVGLLGQS